MSGADDALLDLRKAVVADLKAGDLAGVDYVSENITPPCAVVIPSQPYVTWPDGDNGVPFGHVRVSHDVLLISGRQASKTASATADRQIVKALRALEAHDLTQVSQPGVINLSGSKFMGSVVTIQHTIEEP